MIVNLFRPAVRRTLPAGVSRGLVHTFAVGMALYHVIGPSTWLVPIDAHLAVHLSAVLCMTFLILGASSRATHRLSILDTTLVALCLMLGLYFVLSGDALLTRALVITPLSSMQVAMAAALVVLLLEAVRRSVGLPFVFVMLIFFLLMGLGPWLPAVWAHPGLSVVQILDLTVWTRLQGIWGIPLRMSATLISLFFIFGKLMQHSGLGELLTSCCLSLAGSSRGGPAKVAVVGSALVGSVTAGPAANMIMTGSLTIPMMKAIGYRPHYAGAVEAAASTGAGIVPPIMTGIVFIMAELTGTSYTRIMLVAIIPAVLYYTCLLLQIHFQAVRTGMRSNERGPDFAEVRRQLAARGHLVFPIVLLVALLIDGYYPATAVVWAIIAVPVTAALRSGTRMGVRKMAQALAEASQELVRVAPVCALSGIVIVALFQTGLGSAFSHVVSTAAGESLLLLSLMGGGACLVLGMGVPPTAAYLMTVLIVAPLMVKLGIPVIVAHFFSLYYANLAFLTPPIAMGALVAASMSGASFWRVSITAVRLASVGFAVPIAFVFRPALLLFGDPLDVLCALAACVLLVGCLAAALEGWMFRRLHWGVRLSLLGAGLALVPPHLTANLVACAVVAAAIWWQFRQRGIAGRTP